MTKRIEFIDTWGDTPERFHPTPARADIPDWYKRAESYIDGQKIPDRRNKPDARTNGTIKRCRPVWDSISAGYLIRLPCDLSVRWTEDEQAHWFEWSKQSEELVSFHPPSQVPNYPGQDGRKQGYPKFYHPWVIRTPKGYSVSISAPAHRDLPFRTLEGVVDTDTYDNVILFPFIFKEPKWEGLLEAGTPIAQVVPFRRETWQMESRQATRQDRNAVGQVRQKLASVFNDGYQTFFWARKEYR